MAQALLAWIRSGRRSLPWREQRDPYSVWVSEIMLQQTQVSTVVPYFERWMGLFPDVQTLAAAPLDAVLKAWEGLGYYSRARNLHRAAQIIVERHAGRLPAERKALLALPGIGRYTAGAILSLAFGQAEPVLDSNVRRVLSRVYDVAEDVRLAATEEHLWRLAGTLVAALQDPRDARDLNEGLMELGATICVSGMPRCLACPLIGVCRAWAHGVQAERPVKPKKAPVPHYDAVAAVIQDDAGHYLIAQRPPSGLLGGLWEFPGALLGAPSSGQQPDDALRARLETALLAELGIQISATQRVARIDHGYTHFRVTVHAYRAELLQGDLTPQSYTATAWVPAEGFSPYAFPTAQVKILRVLGLR